jgi:hypothetical protein
MVMYGKEAGADDPVSLGDPMTSVKFGVKQFIHAVMRIAVFNNIALNLGTGIAQSIYQSIKTIISAVSNEKHLFGMKDLLVATKYFFTDLQRSDQLMQHYHFVDHDSKTQLYSFRYRHAKESWWNTFIIHFPNWVPDYTTRSIIALAQMHHDGVLEAHEVDKKNGTVKFDETKAKMYQGVNGTALKKAVWLENVRWKLQDKSDEKLTRAYDMNQVRAIKDYAAHRVTGGYYQDEQSNIGWGLIGKMVAMYKRYIFRGYENLYSQPYFRSVSGHYDYVTKPDGTIEAVWNKEFFEGHINSIYNGIGKIKEGRKKGLSFLQAYNEIAARSRSQIEVAAMSVMTFLLAQLVFGLAAAGDDDDEEVKARRRLLNTNLVRYVRYSFQDFVTTWWPSYVFQMWTKPIASITYLGRISDISEALLSFDLEKAQKEAGKTVIGGSTFKMFDDMINLANRPVQKP